MTEDTSPENLRKFLESDDPAMVMMGLSMAKGSGVPEEVLPTILKLYMWDEDKTVRAAAKSIFNKHASNELKEKVKESWKPNYRTLSISGDKYPEIVKTFLEAFKSQDDFALIALEPFIKALEDRKYGAAHALGYIGGKLAVEPLIKALEDENASWKAAEALGKIGDKRAVEPLIKALEDERISVSAANALGKIGDKRAVEPLTKTLQKNFEKLLIRGNMRRAAPYIDILRKFGIPGIEGIVRAGGSSSLTLIEIKKLLIERDLPVSGQKNTLIIRLHDVIQPPWWV